MKHSNKSTSLFFGCIALLSSGLINAEPQHSLGVQVTATEFEETDYFGDSSRQFTDDSDTGFGAYYNISWSPLKSVRIGYLDHGEFTYLLGDKEYNGSSDTIYIAWTPYYQINDDFDIGLAIGVGENEPDAQGRNDDDTVMLYSAELNYKIHNSIKLGIEVGTVAKDFGGIDPTWAGFKMAYVW